MIFVWLCVTHSLKAMHKNLYRSKIKSSINLTGNKRKCGWQYIVDSYKQAIKCRKRNVISFCMTKLAYHGVIELDKYTVQNTKYTKLFFLDETITKVIRHLIEENNIEDINFSEKELPQKNNFNNILT